MSRVISGNHTAVRVPRSQRERVRSFYRDVLGATITRATEQKDDLRLADGFYFAFLYEDDAVALDESGFRKAIFLELKSDDVDELRRQIVAFGVTVLEVPDSHLYFQAPGGQVFRLVGIHEDLSKYEGTAHGELNVGATFAAHRS